MLSPKPRSPYFQRVIDALALASPICLASRFENSMAHCCEASICGAAALQQWQIKARALPCAIVGQHPSLDVVLAVGLNAREIYARQGLHVADADVGAFELWLAEHGTNLPGEDRFVAHMVIEAQFQGDRALIDLTFGQIRGSYGLPVSMHTIWYGPGWPAREVDGWQLEYIDSPRAKQIAAEVGAYLDRGYVSDIKNLMDLALQCRGDMDTFHGALARAQPEEFERAWRRIGTLAGTFGALPGNRAS